MLRFRRMDRRLVEDDDIRAELYAELGILPEETLPELSRLPDEILSVFLELLVLSGIVPDDDQFDVVGLRNAVEACVVDDRRLKGIDDVAVRVGRGFLQIFEPVRSTVACICLRRPNLALSPEPVPERRKSNPLRVRHEKKYSKKKRPVST